MTKAVTLTEAEKEQRDRFGGFYRRNQLPVMQRIERSVCGCDFGGTSWTTREEADAIIAALQVGKGDCILDLGAGSGWPGLYLASTGCDMTLVDLPPEGLVIAAERAATEGVPGDLHVASADARCLPFKDAFYDAVTHSDLLCCMPGKQAALAEFRRVVRDGSQMIFSTIVISSSLSEGDRALASEIGPQFVASANPYDQMLAATGWALVSMTDLSDSFMISALDFIKHDEANRQEFIDLLGEDAFQWRQNKNTRLADAVRDGLLRRDLYEMRAV